MFESILRLRLFLLPLSFCLAACASPTLHTDPERAARVERACGQILGLKRNEAQYVQCADSLNQSMTSLNDGKAAEAENAARLRVIRLQDACVAVGFERDSSASAACMRELDAALSTRTDD